MDFETTSCHQLSEAEHSTLRFETTGSHREHSDLTSRLFHLDARDIDNILGEVTVNLTITSPPYFDIKNYGLTNQVGFGQSYETYLNDLTSIFNIIFHRTAYNGSLWVVIDSFRRDGTMVPLPFDLSNRLKLIGWNLKDVIIWKKDRTLPWTHQATTRNIFEYIMVFGKAGQVMKYYPDRVRDHTDLKRWWVRYPERYHPKGKALEEVWNISIPTQGTWGKKTPRHFCPFPAALVRRIVRLASDEGDVIFDPFAGTGSVLREAFSLKRRSLGCELDNALVSEFNSRLTSLVPLSELGEEISDSDFETTIIQLRILKYGRQLLRHVSTLAAQSDIWVYADQSKRKHHSKNAIVSADFFIYCNCEKVKLKQIQEHLLAISKKPPLSKFGIDSELIFSNCKITSVAQLSTQKRLFIYSITNTHKYRSALAKQDIESVKFSNSVISPLGISLEEPHE